MRAAIKGENRTWSERAILVEILIGKRGRPGGAEAKGEGARRGRTHTLREIAGRGCGPAPGHHQRPSYYLLSPILHARKFPRQRVR